MNTQTANYISMIAGNAQNRVNGGVHTLKAVKGYVSDCIKADTTPFCDVDGVEFSEVLSHLAPLLDIRTKLAFNVLCDSLVGAMNVVREANAVALRVAHVIAKAAEEGFTVTSAQVMTTKAARDDVYFSVADCLAELRAMEKTRKASLSKLVPTAIFLASLCGVAPVAHAADQWGAIFGDVNNALHENNGANYLRAQEIISRRMGEALTLDQVKELSAMIDNRSVTQWDVSETVINKLGNTPMMNKTIVATALTAAIVSAAPAHSSMSNYDINYLSSQAFGTVDKTLSYDTMFYQFSYQFKSIANSTAKYPTAGEIQTAAKRLGFKFDKTGNLIGYVDPNAPKTQPVTFTDGKAPGGVAPVVDDTLIIDPPKPVVKVPTQPTTIPATQITATPAKPSVAAPVAKDSQTVTKPAVVSVTPAAQPIVTAPAQPNINTTAPAPTANPSNPVAPATPVYQTVNSAAVVSVAPAAQSIPVAQANPVSSTTVVDTSAQDAAHARLVALAAPAVAAKAGTPNYGAQDVQAHNDAVDMKAFNDKFHNTIAPTEHKRHVMQDQLAAQAVVDAAKTANNRAMSLANTVGGKATTKANNTVDNNPHAVNSGAVPQYSAPVAPATHESRPNTGAAIPATVYNSPSQKVNDHSQAIANIQGGKATSQGAQTIAIVNPVHNQLTSTTDLSGFVINPQTDNDSHTNTVAKDIVKPPVYVAPTPTPVAKTPVAVTPATPKAPVVAPAAVAPVVAPATPATLSAVPDQKPQIDTVIVNHLPGKLTVKVDNLPQVHGFASTSTDIVDTQKVTPIVVPAGLHDTMNQGHNNPTGAPTPVKAPVTQAPLTITTDAKQVAPQKDITGTTVNPQTAQHFSGVGVQTIQDPDQTVTIVKNDPVVKTSVAKAAISAKPVVLSTPQTVPTPATTAAPVAQANTVNTTAPVLTVAPTTTAQAQPTAQPTATPAAQPTVQPTTTPAATTPAAKPTAQTANNAPTATPAAKPVTQPTKAAPVANTAATNTPAPVKPLGAKPGVTSVTTSKPAQGAYAQNQAAQAQAITNANSQASAHVLANTAALNAQGAQLNDLEQSTNSRFSSMEKTIKQDRKHASQGIANVAAMANIPQVLENQDWSVGAGVGAFDGQTGIAVGASARVNEHTTVKFTVGAGSTGGATVGAGVSIGY